MKKSLIFILLASVVVLTSCVTAPEEFRFERLGKVKVQPSHTMATFICSLDNPNRRSIRVRDLDVYLNVEGVKLGHIEEVGPIRLKGNGRSEFEAMVRIEHGGLLRVAPMAVLKKELNVEVRGDFKVRYGLFGAKVRDTKYTTVNVKAEVLKLLQQVISSELAKRKD